jgi:signal transduction histidine kinase
MFHSLRARLIVSYLVVILLTLCIAAVGLFVSLQEYQRSIVTQRLMDALGPATAQARMGLNNGAPVQILANDIQEQLNSGWRVLFIDAQGAILADSKTELLGQRLPRIANLQYSGRLPFTAGRQLIAGRDLIFVASPVRQTNTAGIFLVLATPLRPTLESIQELFRPLLFAGISALLAAILLAIALARSIAEPLGQLTRATEAIARNHYDTQIPVRGDDEVGRLAASFNAMARAVQLSHRAQRDFVANVSHELKTPLTSIQGFSQAILDDATRDLAGAKYAAQFIHEEARRMARLVADLLTLARLDARDVPLELHELNLADILPVWLERFQARAQTEGISLTHAIAAPPWIVGDAARLEQLVNNLVDNAFKYNKPGGTVHVTLSGVKRASSSRGQEHGESVYALLRVQDSGQGIPPAAQARLFERFYRADPARAAGGSGLGLAIVQEIVHAHHGEISVTSEPGRGTVFSVWLPAHPMTKSGS